MTVHFISDTLDLGVMYPGLDAICLHSSGGGQDGNSWSLPAGSQAPLDLKFQPFVEDKGNILSSVTASPLKLGHHCQDPGRLDCQSKTKVGVQAVGDIHQEYLSADPAEETGASALAVVV